MSSLLPRTRLQEMRKTCLRILQCAEDRALEGYEPDPRVVQEDVCDLAALLEELLKERIECTSL